MSILAFLLWLFGVWFLAQGLGRLALRFHGRGGIDLLHPWVGMATLLGVVEIIHLLMPLRDSVGYALGIVAALGWVLGSPRSKVEIRGTALELGVLLLVAILVGWGGTMSVVLQYDWGLYYQQSQKWAAACPAVPGLGNLHSRLGFPGASFLLAGLLDHLTRGEWGARILGAWFVCQSITTWLIALFRNRRTLVSWKTGYAAVSVTVVSLSLMSLDLAVAGPDLLSAMMLLVLGWVCLSFLDGEESYGRMVLPMMSGVLFLKMSAVGLLPLLALLLWKKGWRPHRWETFLWGVLVAGWMAHSWILTGYPLYPISVPLGVPDWKMDPTRVGLVSRAIRGWAHLMGPHYLEALEGYPWFGWWWRHVVHSLDWEVLWKTGALVGLGGLLGFVPGKRQRIPPAMVWFFLPLVGALAFWWISAPDIRFARGILWILMAWLGAMAFQRMTQPWIPRLLLAGAFFLIAPNLYEVATRTVVALQPSSAVHEVLLPSGIRIWVPSAGDQVWNAPIPATPEITHLIPRGSSLCDGFRDGGKMPPPSPPSP